MKHTMKKKVWAIFIALSIFGNGSSVLSMEKDQNDLNNESETKKKIVNYFENKQHVGAMGTKYFCWISFPYQFETREESLNYIKSCSIRDPMSLPEYFEKTKGEKTMIVGSGLFQTMIQPIQMKEFKNSFFVDTDEGLYPDICGEFCLNFVSDQGVANYKEQFDAIYFDNFDKLYSEETIKAAAFMLKPGGKLMMTYKTQGNGINLSEEAELLHRSLFDQLSPMLVRIKIHLNNRGEFTKENYDDMSDKVVYRDFFDTILLDFWGDLISDRLTSCGFTFAVKDNDKVFRSGVGSDVHIFAIKL